MSANVQLIWKKIEHLRRMRNYLVKARYSGSVDQWKMIRELRNAINHENEENEQRLSEFFQALTQAAPDLYKCFTRIIEFCTSSYPAAEDLSAGTS